MTLYLTLIRLQMIRHTRISFCESQMCSEKDLWLQSCSICFFSGNLVHTSTALDDPFSSKENLSKCPAKWSTETFTVKWFLVDRPIKSNLLILQKGWGEIKLIRKIKDLSESKDETKKKNHCKDLKHKTTPAWPLYCLELQPGHKSVRGTKTPRLTASVMILMELYLSQNDFFVSPVFFNI